jgi:hypothetical protein
MSDLRMMQFIQPHAGKLAAEYGQAEDLRMLPR